MLKNQKGIVALAVILSMLMVIGAIAVFGLVSGRFTVTYRLARRPQAILDAESASYVTYMMMREGDWVRGTTPTVTFRDFAGDGEATNRRIVNINILDDGTNQVKSSPVK